MEELLLNEIKVGDRVKGQVLSVADAYVLVDLHQFAEGTIYVNEFDPALQTLKGVVKVGQELEAVVKKVDEEHGKILLSRLPLLKEAQDNIMADLSHQQKTIKVKIDKNINFGLVGKYLGNDVFIPKTQVSLDDSDLDSFVGKTLEVRLKEFDENRKRYVASRKELLIEKERADRQAELDSLKVGDVLEGVVAKIDEHLGAFVRFKHNQGLIRYRELSHTPFNKINDVLNVGDKVTVKILAIDGNKIDLSRKALVDTPYEVFAKEHKVSDVVEGKIVQKLPIGAIVELAPFVTALLHKNEISWNPNDNTFASFKIGSLVKAQIISLDAKKNRIGLSMKTLEDNPWAKVKTEVGATVKATIDEIVAGRYLKVSLMGVEGIIPVHEVPMKEKSSKLEDYYAVGDQVEGVVTLFDPKLWKLEISIKKYTSRIEREQFEEYMKKEQEKETTITLGDLFKDILK